MKLHNTHGKHASAVPNMPLQMQSEDGMTFVFRGSPAPLKPILKGLMRFERPMLTVDPFEHPPSDSWKEAKEKMMINHPAAQTSAPNTSSRNDETELRDERAVNNVVHNLYSQAEYRRNTQEMAVDNFAKDSQVRVEVVDIGELYLLEIEKPEFGMRLGLAKVAEKKASGANTTWVVEWFKLTSGGWRVKNPTFVQHKVGNRRSTDEFDITCFRLHVPLDALTTGSRKEKDVKPKLTKDFTLRVLNFAHANSLKEDEDVHGDNTSSSDEGEHEQQDQEHGQEGTHEEGSRAQGKRRAPADKQGKRRPTVDSSDEDN